MNMAIQTAVLGPMTSIKLNDDNYLFWADGVQTYLIGQNKQQYLTGTAPASTDTNYAKWIEEDARTRSFISQSTLPDVNEPFYRIRVLIPCFLNLFSVLGECNIFFYYKWFEAEVEAEVKVAVKGEVVEEIDTAFIVKRQTIFPREMLGEIW